MKLNKNFKFIIENSARGFNLIELLVATAIVGILAATAVVNIAKNNDRDVRAEKDRLTTFLREVQNKSLAIDKSNVSGSGKICGFGISQQGDSTIQSYYVMAPNYDAVCSDDSIVKTYDSSRKSDIFYLKNDVKIEGTFPDIFFLSPNGYVYSNGSALVGTVYISLKKESIVLNNIISIDSSGRIY